MKNKNYERIANRQLWFILFMMRSVIILSFMPVLTSADAMQDAWISALITLLGSEIFFILFILLDIQFPNLTIVEYSQKLLGSWLGKLLGFIFLWIFLQFSLVDIRLYAELLKTSFLPNTPSILIIMSMVIVSAICVYSGIEVLGRTSDILIFFFLLMILGIIFIPLGVFDIKNIQPVFVHGWRPVFKGSLVPIALIGQTWVLGMISVTTTTRKKSFWVPVTSIGASLLLLMVISLITVGVIGPYEGYRSTFPILTLMRSVELSDFLQRTEALIVFGWGMGLFISVSTFLYSGAKGMSQWLNLNDYRSVLLPMSVIWVFMATYGFKNIFMLYSFLSPEVFTPYGFSLLVIPLAFLWLGCGVKKLKNIIRKGNE